jgi:hypothetical protein
MFNRHYPCLIFKRNRVTSIAWRVEISGSTSGPALPAELGGNKAWLWDRAESGEAEISPRAHRSKDASGDKLIWGCMTPNSSFGLT